MTLEQANEAMRAAVMERLASTPADDPKLATPSIKRFNPPHPSSQAFYDLCDELKQMHSRKSKDYGSTEDPLANIRSGAKLVGIEPWRAALVRLSDKVTRIETYCRLGALEFESFEDTCLDLASYALLTLLMHRADRE